MKINRISPQDNNFLQIIAPVANAPKRLYFQGKLPEDRPPTVAIVGTRRPTPYGKDITYTIASELARSGVVIVSGLALGVDAIVHQAALDVKGKTIAVLANGLDSVYPASNRGLAKKILESGGALISEYEPHVKARDYQFLERNRIVSGISDAVLVTEAAERSGTLATAAHAAQQGREMFVTPGNITSPMSIGCNNLIKHGANPITRAQDILDVIAPNQKSDQLLLPLGDTPEEQIIIDILASGISDGDIIQQKSKLDASTFAIALTTLEINSTIRALGANHWTLKR
jgi:DNA processing protein